MQYLSLSHISSSNTVVVIHVITLEVAYGISILMRSLWYFNASNAYTWFPVDMPTPEPRLEKWCRHCNILLTPLGTIQWRGRWLCRDICWHYLITEIDSLISPSTLWKCLKRRSKQLLMQFSESSISLVWCSPAILPTSCLWATLILWRNDEDATLDGIRARAQVWSI